MAGIIQPLGKEFPIIDPNTGKPTEYFIRWAQQRQIDIKDGITAAQAQQLIDEWAAAHSVNAGTGLSGGGTLDTDPTLQLDAGLGDLNDVDLSTPPTDQQVLVYDDASHLWVPADQSGGGGGVGTRKEARVSLTADYGRSGGSDLNVFDPAHTSVNFDNASFWDAANAQFVVPGGITQVRVSCIVAQTGSANFGIRIKKNGTNVALAGDNTNKFKYCSTGVLPVAAGDVIQVAAFSATGWTVAYGSGAETWTWASIEDVSLSSGGGGSGTQLGLTQLHLPADYTISTGAWRTPNTWVVDVDNLGAYTLGNTYVTVPAGVAYVRAGMLNFWSSGGAPRAASITDIVSLTTGNILVADVRTGINETQSSIYGPFIPVTPGTKFYAQYNTFTSNGNLSGASGSNFGKPCRIWLEWYSALPF